MNAIANDYEDFEWVVDMVGRWAVDDGMETPSPSEVAASLVALIEAGYAKAYVLFARQTDWAHEVAAQEWRAVLTADPLVDVPYYFYITKEGKRVLRDTPAE